MSSLRSYRMAKRRIRANHAKVRSTTQRWRPSRSLLSTPRRAMRGSMPRWRQARRQRLASYALSACSLPGLWRGFPGLPLTGTTASSNSASGTLSCTLAPVNTKASGRPLRSVKRWRFVPALPRSVGFGPVAAPPFLPGWTRCPYRLGSSQCGLTSAGAAAVPGASGSRPRLVASRAVGASMSRPSRSPFPGAASPTGYPSAARRECQ